MSDYRTNGPLVLKFYRLSTKNDAASLGVSRPLIVQLMTETRSMVKQIRPCSDRAKFFFPKLHALQSTLTIFHNIMMVSQIRR